MERAPLSISSAVEIRSRRAKRLSNSRAQMSDGVRRLRNHGQPKANAVPKKAHTSDSAINAGVLISGHIRAAIANAKATDSPIANPASNPARLRCTRARRDHVQTNSISSFIYARFPVKI